MRRAYFLLALAVPACASSAPPVPRAQGAGAAASAVPTQVASAALPQAAAPAGPIVFIENDYDHALAEAKAKKLPIVVDVWAPWCHTCLSMREFVFPDPLMRSRAGSFVWLAIDHENDVNETFLAKHPTEALPTIWVIDSATEKPALKWLGSATAPEVAALLDDAAGSIQHGDSGGEAGAALLRGNQLSADGKRVEAVREYLATLAAAPTGWARRAETVDALTERYAELSRWKDCVDLALKEMPTLPEGTAVSDIAQTAISAAYSLPTSDASRQEMMTLIAAGRKLAEDPALAVLPDDRSSLFDHVVEALHDYDAADEAAVATEWAAFLEDQAAKAQTPAERVVFDSHRMAAYMAMGDPGRALPMLEASARDFPKDYNPPARMVLPLTALKRYPEALAASERALGLVYGPRTLRVLVNEADVYKAMGDQAGEKRVLLHAVDLSRGMFGAEGMRGMLQKRLGGLAGGSGG